MASVELPLETFRDPAGSLRFEPNRVLRRVRETQATAALSFLRSDLAQEWIAQGRLIESEFLDSHDGVLTLEHPRVFFPSYPWEWAPSAWVSAAELTLDLCEALLKRGWILKDATPLNVLFRGTQPIFVDVLSVERRDPESPVWLAYGQFVRTFLLPLAAQKYLGWPLSASMQRRDGYEPADLAPYLGKVQRWREPFRSLVTMPLMLEKNGAGAAARAARAKQTPEAALATLRRNLSALRRHLRLVQPEQHSSQWSGYPQNSDHYGEDDQRLKRAFVRDALELARPKRVLDLGANTGVYSRIAADSGAEVVGWDTDLEAAEQNWREAQQSQSPVKTLIANPARPTPSMGWRNAENVGLLERARGQFDCLLMLGLIHHLLLSEQIPLAEIVALLGELTTRWAVVEWVPASDPRYMDLMRGRDDLYGRLDEADFAAAVEPHFTIARREPLPNGRVLFLLQSR